MKKSKREKELEKALYEIATFGKGLKTEIVDWVNVGKNAMDKAQRALSVCCKECGRTKPFRSKAEK